MKCPNCSQESARIITKIIDGKPQTRCHSCGNFSELSHISYLSPLTKQKHQWQRDKFGRDILQPFEIRKGEVAKGWQANKDFIKAYKNEPGKLSKFSISELRDSGVVKKEVAKQAQKMPWGDKTPIPRPKLNRRKK